MNGRELLTGLGYINVRYFEEAETAVLAPKTPGRYESGGRKNHRRPLLVAAMIGLMLLLVGCAVAYALNVKNLHMGQVTRKQYVFDENRQPVAQTEVVLDVISAQGIMGSPNYLAAQEWLEFEENYELNLETAETFAVPAGYEVYHAFSQEMVDKVDEICEKYDLKPMGTWTHMQSYQFDVLYQALGFDSLFHGGAEMDGGAGYFMECGNFNVMFSFTLTSEDADWKHPIGATMRYADKEYFDTISFGVGDIETVRQRNYTTADGMTILVVGEGNSTILLCDREDAFLSVYFDPLTLDHKTVELSDRDIERICEGLDFSIKPRKPDMDEVEFLLAEAETAYQERIHADDPKTVEELMATLDRSFWYTLEDLNGDGEDEVLVSADGETLKYVYTKIGGGYVCYVTHWREPDEMPYPSESAMYLCGDNSLEIYSCYEDGSFFHYYFKLEKNVEKNGSSDVGYVRYDAQEGKWHSKAAHTIYDPATDSYIPYERNDVLTEAEARKVITAHPRKELELKPIGEFPVN